MKLEIDLSGLVEAIATAVVEKIAAEGGTVVAETPPADDKPKNTGKKAGAKAAPAKVKREDVLAAVRAYGEATSKDKAKGLIGKYAAAFGDVKDEDLPKLLADVKKAEEGGGESVDEGDGY